MAHRRFEIGRVEASMYEAYVQIGRSETEWWQVPETMKATVALDGYRAEIVTGIDSTLSPTITRISIERDADGPPISDLVRGPWERVLAEVVERGAIRWQLVDDEKNKWRAKGFGIPSGAGSQAIVRGRRSAQQREEMEHQVQQVIDLWPEAQQQTAPIEFLRERLGLSRRTTQRRVEKALERMNREES